MSRMHSHVLASLASLTLLATIALAGEKPREGMSAHTPGPLVEVSRFAGPTRFRVPIDGTLTALEFAGAAGARANGILVEPTPPSVGCPEPTAQVGIAYRSTVVASDGTPPYTFSVGGNLPPGLTLDPATGTFSGTPTAAGQFDFTVSATDAAGAVATGECGILVAPAPLSVGCPAPAAQVGVAYSSAAVASGGTPPYTYSIGGSLPAGLTLDPAAGTVSGTPTAAGQFGFTVSATDAAGAVATNECGILVAPSLLSVGCPAPTGQVGVAYSSAVVASGGTPPYTYSIGGSLPAGLTLDPATGTISGRPTAPGTISFTVEVADAGAVRVTSDCAITIEERSSGCGSAVASPATISKHDHKLQKIEILGVGGPDAGPVTITVTGVTQDEPLLDRDSDGDVGDDRDDHGDRLAASSSSGFDPNAPSAGGGADLGARDDRDTRRDHKKCPDAMIDAQGNVFVRRERLEHGNGRVYAISFTATDAQGSRCNGTVRVCVPGDRRHDSRLPHRADCLGCIDDGQTVNSLGPCPPRPPRGDHDGDHSASAPDEVALAVGPGTGRMKTFEYSLPVASELRIAVYDIAGRQVAMLFAGPQGDGVHRLSWNAAGFESGIYFCRLHAGRVVVTKSVLILK